MQKIILHLTQTLRIKKNGIDMKIKSGYDAVMFIGQSLYGSKFCLDDKRLAIYKDVYTGLLQDNPKGFLIIGSKGVGKSTLMRIMQKVFLGTQREFVAVDALKIKDLLDEYSVSEIKSMYGFDLKKDLLIDDIGKGATEIKEYGNTINIISELLFERYDLYIKEGYLTHLTSNIITNTNNTDVNIVTLEKLYKDRVYDRLKEMTRVINWSGQSLRGNNQQ